MPKALLTRQIGMAIRTRREARKFSQESFADEIRMHRTYYGAIERGEKNLQVSTLQRVCEGLHTTVWEVLRDAEAAEYSVPFRKNA